MCVLYCCPALRFRLFLYRSYNIFNDAMSAVLAMMETNFSADFKNSMAYKQLERSVENEAKELEVLKKVRHCCVG